MINKREFWGAIIIIIGLILLIGNLDFLDYSFRKAIRDLWPIILILIGIALIIHHSRRTRIVANISIDGTTQADFQQRRDFSQVFGDNNIEARNTEIDGLNCSTIFGETSINLAGAKLKAGMNGIDISTVFGDVTVIVPGDMEARAYSSSTFGDLYILGRSASGISTNLSHQTEGYDAAQSKVHISARATFGSVKIYRA